MGRLTRHVLDTASGRSAAGLKIELWSHGKGQVFVRSTTTKSDGRIDAPIPAKSVSASPMNSSTITRLCFCRLMATQPIAGADDHGA
jgi:5-hydroxyisourate hydrolase-like protein (transthyretin family)